MLQNNGDAADGVLRILVLEDDSDDADLQLGNLRQSGMRFEARRVETRADFARALPWNPDVILADYNLPGFDAITALHMVQEQGNNTPVVIVSGAIGEDRAVAAINEGAADYLLKDRLARLSSAVTNAVTKHRLASARMAAEAKLAEEQNVIRILLETLPDAVFVKDASSRFLRINQALARALGVLQPEDAIGKTDADFFPRGDAAEYLSDEQRLLESGEPLLNKLEQLTVDGAMRWLLTTKVPFRGADGEIMGLVGISRDITAQHHMNGELKQARDAAEDANRYKSAFLSKMSHELRTPMTAIIGYSSLLLEDTTHDLAPEQRLDVQQIATSADRLLGLINDILDLSRIEAGEITLVFETVALQSLLAAVVAEVAPLAIAKGAALVLSPIPPLPDLYADLPRLHQILLNLVGNAIKFTVNGGVLVRVTHRDQTIRIAVRDTGIGIAASVLPHVFDEFRQADPSTTRRYGGSGLGLAIAKRLTELHGGTIEVESSMGEGSTFTLVLPAPGPRLEPGANADNEITWSESAHLAIE